MNQFVIAASMFVSVSAFAGTQDAFEPDADASRAFGELVDAYRARPAITIKSALVIELEENGVRSEPEKVTIEIVSSNQGQFGRVRIREYDCVFRDGDFYATHAENEETYFHERYEGSPYWTILLGFQDIPYPHLALLWGEPVPEETWMQLHPHSPSLVPTKLEEPGAETTNRRITLSSPGATFMLEVDPKTNLIARAEHEITGGPFVQAGTVRRTSYTFEHTVALKPMPAEDFAFEPGEREAMGAIIALAPAPEAPAGGGGGGSELVGEPAPPFILATLDGRAIDLEDLQGRVVVLDFWATWCGPCRRALPSLHQVAEWARLESLPVTVVTVNVWESRDPAKNTPDHPRQSAERYWSEQGFTLPVAMDYTDEVAASYGISGIPATIVIRSDGVVHAAHAGAGDSYVDLIKGDIQGALDAISGPADDTP